MNYKRNIEEYFKTIPKPYNMDYMLWYIHQHLWLLELRDKFDKRLEFLAAITAVFSINNRWSETKKKVIEYLETGEVVGTNLMKNKIERLENCNMDEQCIKDILSGMKIQNFFVNLYRPYETQHITIDRYMYRIAGHHREGLTTKQYKQIAKAYKELAWENKMIPNRFQALLWCHKINK